MNAITSNHLAKGRPPESNLYVMWQTNLAGLFTRVDRAVCMCIVLWKCGVWSIECKVELCMQDLELMASSLWIPEFTEPHNTFEHAATDHRASIMACWESLQTFFFTFEEGSICINLHIWIYLHEWTGCFFYISRLCPEIILQSADNTPFTDMCAAESINMQIRHSMTEQWTAETRLALISKTSLH